MGSRDDEGKKTGINDPIDIAIDTRAPLEDRARKAIRASLLLSGLDPESVLRFRCDGGGLRVDVVVKAASMAEARAWRDTFGRSYGPIRIYLLEAP